VTDKTETADGFVRRLCHEFRTPLTVIREYAAIAAAGDAGAVSPRQREFLQIISDAAGDMARLVEDLLDGSRLRAGRLRVGRRPCRVSDIIPPLRPMMAIKAAGRDVRFRRQIDCPSRQVFVDEESLRRVITNLAVGAVDFCPAGGEVVLWARPDGGGVEVGVTDGDITPAETEGIIRQFRRIEAGPAAEVDGLAPGLSIAGELIRLNLGTIRVSGGSGGGGTFSFALPGCDPAVLLDRYFDCLSGRPEAADRIYAFRVEWPGSRRRRDDVWSFLASTCDPTDLILPVEAEDALLVIGPSGSITGWIDRLWSCWADVAGDDAPAGDIAIEPVGCWSLRRQRPRARSFLAGRVCREAACHRAVAA
jgi:hypothetical protein